MALPVRLPACIACLALALLLAPPATVAVCAQDAQEAAPPRLTRIVPKPAARRDPSLVAFLVKLKEIVRKRDAAAFVPLLVEDIGIEFGFGPQGRKAFPKHWKLKDRNSYFWRETERLLTLEGDDNHPGAFCLPYAWWNVPDYLNDNMTGGVIVRDRTPLLAAPSATAPVIATLSYDIVEEDLSHELDAAPGAGNFDKAGEPRWIKVLLADGRRGYVAPANYWSFIGTRIEFTLIDGRWRITAFVAGD